jgi:beta-phosphoglucomutase-like phosphatase (HAD superfamily)
MEAETYPLRRERYEFLRWFDGTVVSAFERIAKPDQEIFRRLLERFGLKAQSTLFIDDSQPNLDAAASLGIQTVRFESPGQLRGRLEDAGLLAAPGSAGSAACGVGCGPATGPRRHGRPPPAPRAGHS